MFFHWRKKRCHSAMANGFVKCSVGITAKEGQSFGKKGKKNHGKMMTCLWSPQQLFPPKLKIKSVSFLSSYSLYMDSTTIADVIFSTLGRVMFNCLTNIYQLPTRITSKRDLASCFSMPNQPIHSQTLQLSNAKALSNIWLFAQNSRHVKPGFPCEVLFAWTGLMCGWMFGRAVRIAMAPFLTNQSDKQWWQVFAGSYLVVVF